MCGICGIVGAAPAGALEAMNAAMHHRGPDDAGTWRGPGVALGMRRLSIIDTSTAAHQPMSNAAGTVHIVYNGEMYNFRAERRALEARGHTFRSHSDTEVVLHLYEEYGDAFLTRLRGMFALALCDLRSGTPRLVLARDPFGIKPLLYAAGAGRLVFASELKALLAGGLVERRVDETALGLLLLKGAVPQPLTMIRGVAMLPAGHFLEWRDGAIRLQAYHTFHARSVSVGDDPPYEILLAEARRRLEESVTLQMVSDVPLGAFLSGGVDSSLLVALMARQAKERLRTFSVGFGAEGRSIDESDDAGRLARHIGTEHTRVEIHGEEVRERIEHIAAALDQPSVDGVNSYFVCRAAREGGLTVAVSGTGGDELFAGYPWFAALLGAAEEDLPWRFSREYMIFSEDNLRHLLPSGLQPAEGLETLHRRWAQAADLLPAAGPLERISVLCLRGYTQNQLLRDIDAVSMALSLEVRVPFLDPDILDLALALPPSAKLLPAAAGLDPYRASYRESGAKRIVIDMGRGLLPDDLDRQCKRGFALPFAAWLQGPLRDVLRDTLDADTVERRGLVRGEKAARLREHFLAGRVGWPKPWLLMMLELWCRRVLDAAPAAVSRMEVP